MWYRSIPSAYSNGAEHHPSTQKSASGQHSIPATTCTPTMPATRPWPTPSACRSSPASASPDILRGMDDHSDHAGFLPVIGVGTLLVFYLVWAALHDIARGERDPRFEYGVLAVSVPAFALLYRMALRLLRPQAKTAWLGGTGVLVLLFDLAALSARLRPRYPLDPMLGSLFLAVGLPLLVLISHHLVREACLLRSHPRS